MRGRLLVVDDKENFLALFRRIVPRDLEVVCASDGARALELLSAELFDVVVSDVRLPGADGMTLLRRVREAGLDVEVILITAYGTIHDAVRAMKLGASDYLTKPFDPDDAVAAIEAALARRHARTHVPPPRTLASTSLVGQSAGMRRVFEAIARAASSDAPVLVTGESGTGKELVARTIHARGVRSERRFVPMNCGAAADAADAEIFGYLRGAVAGAAHGRRGALEEASGGTLFLDEIEALPFMTQAKITRTVKDRVFRRLGAVDEVGMSARLIGATDIDLARLVDQGKFRVELYERMNVLAIDLPPLRDRRDDISVLATALLKRLAPAAQKARTLSPEALAALVSHDWPGNVRQLETTLARMIANSSADVLPADAVPDDVRSGRRVPTRPAIPLAAMPYREALSLHRERATREYLLALIEDVRGNVTQAAERAGIERESFHRLMKRHGVRAEDYRPK